jgi:hypothetical protein
MKTLFKLTSIVLATVMSATSAAMPSVRYLVNRHADKSGQYLALMAWTEDADSQKVDHVHKFWRCLIDAPLTLDSFGAPKTRDCKPLGDTKNGYTTLSLNARIEEIDAQTTDIFEWMIAGAIVGGFVGTLSGFTSPTPTRGELYYHDSNGNLIFSLGERLAGGIGRGVGGAATGAGVGGGLGFVIDGRKWQLAALEASGTQSALKTAAGPESFATTIDETNQVADVIGGLQKLLLGTLPVQK